VGVILRFLKSGYLAFGGCISPFASMKPVYSVIGHWDADHSPVNNVEIIAFLNPPEKILKYVRTTYRRIPLGETLKTSITKKESFILKPISLRDLKRMGVDKKLHDSRKTGTVPILIGYRYKKTVEYALYIDDIDVDDVEPVKKVIGNHILKFGGAFRGVLLPAYHGTKGHKAKDSKELAMVSKELLEYAAQKLEFVITLAHPSIPYWLHELQKKYDNIHPFDREILVVSDLEEYQKEEQGNEN